VQDEPDPQWLCRADVRAGLAAVSAVLVYDLLVKPQLAAALDTVRSLPEDRLVLDQAGKPSIANGIIEPWRSVFEPTVLPNVAVKPSGPVTEADNRAWTVDQLRPYVETLPEGFDPQWNVRLEVAGLPARCRL
jgi:L-fuconolactonase